MSHEVRVYACHGRVVCPRQFESYKFERIKDFTATIQNPVTTPEGQAELVALEDWALQWCTSQVEKDIGQCLSDLGIPIVEPDYPGATSA